MRETHMPLTLSTLDLRHAWEHRAKDVYVNRLPELTDWDARPFAAAERRRQSSS